MIAKKRRQSMREIEFLGRTIVELRNNTVIRAVKMLRENGWTILLRPDGRVAVSDSSLFKFAFLPKQYLHSHGLLAESLVKLGVVEKSEAAAYLKEHAAHSARRRRHDAAAEFECNAEALGLSLTRRQLAALKKAHA